MATRVIVDSDVYAYACGGATQRTVYDWLAIEGEEIIDTGVASSKDELAEVRSTMSDGARLEYTEEVEAEPLINALALCKRSLLGVEEAMDAAGVEFDKLELFLTGKGNFREELATIKGYKANRIGVAKPVHYKAIRRYMRERWGAVVCRGYEADDALAMAAHLAEYAAERVVLVSQDKDLRTVPGRHYNPRKKEWSLVTPAEAARNFYMQVLTGDSVDNIGGCYKVGPSRAERALDAETTEEGMYLTCLEEYRISMSKKGCPYVEMTPEAALLENARLLHLQRWEGQVWEPPCR